MKGENISKKSRERERNENEREKVPPKKQGIGETVDPRKISPLKNQESGKISQILGIDGIKVKPKIK